MKVLTSAAALAVLGPDHRITTTVVARDAPGESRARRRRRRHALAHAGGQEPLYAGARAPRDLAAQVKAAWDADPAPGQRITRIVLDASYFGDHLAADAGPQGARPTGYMPEITALHGRRRPREPDRDRPRTRSTDPVGRAGAAPSPPTSARSRGRRAGTAPAGATVLGTVRLAAGARPSCSRRSSSRTTRSPRRSPA